MLSFRGLLDFDGKVVVVSGGLGLIGQHVSRAFAEFGATLVVADIDSPRFDELFADTDKVSFEQIDIAMPNEIRAGIDNVLRQHRKIDVWVNCAYPRTSDWGNLIDDVTFESWDKNVRAHLGGYFWTSKLVLEAMKERRAGCLVNFGSTYGMVAPKFDIYDGTSLTTPVAYSAIKAGIVNLSRYFAALYGPLNIRVNCVCPGGVYDNQGDRFVQAYSSGTPLRRMAKDYEMALPVVFLASDAASYITGQALMVDGGWTIW